VSRHNQQLEILAARQRLFNGGFRIDRHRFNDDTHTGGTPHSVKVEQQPVGDVHERRGAGTPCREPLFDTRPRPPVRLDRRRTRPLGEFPGAQIAEPRRRGPEGTGDEDALTGARPERVRASAGLSSSVPSTVMLAMATAERERSPPTTMQPHTPAAAATPAHSPSRSVSGATHRLESRCVGRAPMAAMSLTVAATARQPRSSSVSSGRSACTPATAMSVATTNRGSAMRMTAASSPNHSSPGGAGPNCAASETPIRSRAASSAPRVGPLYPGPGFGVRTHLA